MNVLNFLIAGFVLYVLWSAIRPRWHFKIVVRQDVVEFFHGFPDAKRGAVESFFLNDLKPHHKVIIYGRRERTGSFTTLVKGIEDQGQKQRIRNFLLSIL